MLHTKLQCTSTDSGNILTQRCCWMSMLLWWFVVPPRFSTRSQQFLFWISKIYRNFTGFSRLRPSAMLDFWNVVILLAVRRVEMHRLMWVEVIVCDIRIQGRRSLWVRGDMSPNIYEGGRDVHGNVPPNILELMSFRMSTRVTTRNYVQIPKESGWT